MATRRSRSSLREDVLWKRSALGEWFSRLTHSLAWWVGLVTTTVAVIDGYRLYEGWDPRLIGWLTVIDWKIWAGVFLLIGSFQVFNDVRNERNSLNETLDTRRRLLAFKTLLGIAMKQGAELHANKKMTTKEAEEWVSATNSLITDALGDGEAQLFQSDANYTFYVGSNTTQRLWVEGRLRRLAELQTRIDSLTIRPEFTQSVS